MTTTTEDNKKVQIYLVHYHSNQRNSPQAPGHKGFVKMCVPVVHKL